jgi:hypothetical protein
MTRRFGLAVIKMQQERWSDKRHATKPVWRWIAIYA